MGPTNPTEAHFIRGLWGWLSSAWVKLGVLWGYSDRLAEVASDTDLAAGTSNLDDSPVPAGEVWVVTAAAVTYTGTPPTSVDIRLVYPGVLLTVLVQAAPATGVSYPVVGQFILKEGDYMRARVVGATLHDSLYLRYSGYKMAVA